LSFSRLRANRQETALAGVDYSEIKCEASDRLPSVLAGSTRTVQLQLFNLDSASVRQTSRIGGWLLAAAVVFFSVSPASLRLITPLGHTREHFFIHALLGLAFGIGYTKRPWLLAFGLVAFTGAIELAQLFVPGRHARLRDFLIDAGAACLGVGLAWLGRVVMSILSKSSHSTS
jgi:VanZ family protein